MDSHLDTPWPVAEMLMAIELGYSSRAHSQELSHFVSLILAVMPPSYLPRYISLQWVVTWPGRKGWNV